MFNLPLDHVTTTETKPVRVLIADDFAPFLDSLTQVINTLAGLESVGAARDGEETLALCKQTQPDVVLIDINMPVMDGVVAARLIKQQWPHIRIIGLTGFDELDRTQDIIDAGACMCLSKTTSASELQKHLIKQ
jgi:DNA-binding NarL/FixJ family response regulator